MVNYLTKQNLGTFQSDSISQTSAGTGKLLIDRLKLIRASYVLLSCCLEMKFLLMSYLIALSPFSKPGQVSVLHSSSITSVCILTYYPEHAYRDLPSVRQYQCTRMATVFFTLIFVNTYILLLKTFFAAYCHLYIKL